MRGYHHQVTAGRTAIRNRVLFTSGTSTDTVTDTNNTLSTITPTNTTMGTVSSSSSNDSGNNDDGKELILNLLNAALIGYFGAVLGEVAWKLLKARRVLL